MPRATESHPRFLRLLQIVRALSSRRYGLSVSELGRLTGVSRPSVYRDLEALELCGYALDRREINGEVRLSLAVSAPDLAENAPSLDARLAYELLRGLYFASLAGLTPVDALDAHFRRLVLKPPRPSGALPEPAAAVVSRRRALCAAMDGGRRVRLTLRDPRTSTTRTLDADPKCWRLVRGQIYLRAWIPEVGGYQMLKDARLRDVQVLDTPQDDTAAGPELLESAPDAGYDAAPVEVVVAFPARLREVLEEYPLNASQRIQLRDDGRIEARVTCTNLLGALRWVIGWGGDAEALAPPALRERLIDEVRALARVYGVTPAPIP